jgi:predicted RND superfamily exporter protein
VRDVGGFGALGVLLVLAATLTASPAGLTLWPIRRAPQPLQAWLRGPGAALTSAFIERRAGAIVGASLLLAGVAGVGAARLNVETDVVVWFQADEPIRIAYDRIRERLSGISPMNLVISVPETSSASEPELVLALANLTAHLEELPEVGKALSVADPLRQLHGGFADDPTQPVPDRLDLIEQYLLLLESVEQLGDVITDDRRHANVLLRLDNNGSEHLLRVASEAESWWQANGVDGHGLRATGIMYEFARAEDEIAMGQIRGLLFAVAAIGALLLLTFRSAKLAALALVPNAVPVLVAFGVMGAFGIALDAGTVLVGNLAFGIAVDNTVHVAVRFQAARAEGLDPSRSLGVTLSNVLSPIVSTTIAVTVGFLVLGLSGFTFTRNLGLLTSGIMVLCLAADVFLLPALLLRQSAGTRAPGAPE